MKTQGALGPFSIIFNHFQGFEVARRWLIHHVSSFESFLESELAILKDEMRSRPTSKARAVRAREL